MFINDQLFVEIGTYNDADPVVVRRRGTESLDPEDLFGNDEWLFVHQDHMQTPRMLTDEVGNSVWRWDSDAFGSTLPEGTIDGGVSYNIRFPGQYYDVESGLHYNWNRFYDPETGRYVTSDPIGLGGGLNTFGYVFGNPLSFNDPAGLAACLGFCIAGGLGVLTAVIGTNMINNPIDGGGGSLMSGDSPLDAPSGSAEPTQCVDKPAIPDFEPGDFCEKMAWLAAKAGAGTFAGDSMGDEPRLIAHYGQGPWIKKRYTHRCPGGKVITIHYFSNGAKNVELKIKSIRAGDGFSGIEG